MFTFCSAPRHFLLVGLCEGIFLLVTQHDTKVQPRLLQGRQCEPPQLNVLCTLTSPSAMLQSLPL